MADLPQNTAVLVSVGPFTGTDGAGVPNLTTVAGKFIKGGATSGANLSLTNVAAGEYLCLFSTGTNDTAGTMTFVANTVTNFVSFAQTWDVLCASYYNQKYASGTTLASLTDADILTIEQAVMQAPGARMLHAALTGSNTNDGSLRRPFIDPNYMVLHGGSNTFGFVGLGAFDIGTLNLPMPDGMSLITPGPELTQIRSSFDELVGGAIVKPGSNSIIKGAYVYGNYNGTSSGYTQPFGFIAKNGTNGQSIPTNFAYIDCVADGDLGADGILHQTKNNDLTPCKYRVVNFRSYAHFDAFNQVANSGGNWPIVGDITGSLFAVDAGAAGWTFARAFVLSSGTVRMSDSYLISYSADPAQAQTIGMNVRPVSATAGATAYLTNVSMAANGTAGSVADIMCGSSPTAGTTGAVLYVSGCTYRTASGAAAVVLPLHDTVLGGFSTGITGGGNLIAVFNGGTGAGALPMVTPGTAGICNVGVVCEQQDGSPHSGAIVEFRAQSVAGVANLAIPGTWTNRTADANGFAQCPISVGPVYAFKTDAGTFATVRATAPGSMYLGLSLLGHQTP